MAKPVVETQSLSETDISPVILKSYYFSGTNYPSGSRLKERYVFDYELELITEADGAMIIGDKTYSLQKGDVIFRKPGQYTQGIMRYSCFVVFIDLKGSTRKDSQTYDIYVPQEFQPLYDNPLIEGIPTLCHSTPEQNYQELFSGILHEFINPKQGSLIRMRTLVLELLLKLYEHANSPVNTLNALVGPHYHPLKKVLEYIEHHIDKKLDLRELALVAGLSPNYFHMIFTKAFGTTPNGYVTELKICRAKELLAGTDYPISEISELCGFENIPYFSYLFGKKTGVSPSEFRRKHSPRL